MSTVYQLGEYKTWTKNRLGDTAFDDASLTQFANDENRDICNSDEWPFMRTVFEGAVTTTDQEYDFPSDCQMPISITLTAPDSNAIYLKPQTFEWFDQNYPDPSQLTAQAPQFWIPIGTTWMLGPTAPDQGYVLRMRYIKEPKLLDSETDTLDVPDSFSEVVVLGMLARALMAGDNYDQAQVVMQERELKFEQMRSRLLARQYGQTMRFGNSRSAYYSDEW